MLKIGNKNGLSLMEVLLAVSILAVGLIGVLRAYVGSLFTLEIGQYSIESINLLKEQMGDVEEKIVKEGEIAVGVSRGTFKDEFKDFEWDSTVEETSTEDLNELRVILSNKNRERTFSVVTYVAKKKPEEEEEEGG